MIAGPNDARLSQRWNALVTAIADECWANSQNPGGGVLEADAGSFRVSLPLSEPDAGRFSRVFTRKDILEQDARDLARKYYEAYKKQRQPQATERKKK